MTGAQTCTKIWLQRLGPSRHFHVSCPSHFRFHVRPFSASISGPFPLSFPAHFRFHFRFHSRFHFHFHFRSISASISALISTFISGPFPLPFSAFHFRSICGSFPVHFRFNFCFHLRSISGSFPVHFASISAFISGPFFLSFVHVRFISGSLPISKIFIHQCPHRARLVPEIVFEIVPDPPLHSAPIILILRNKDFDIFNRNVFGHYEGWIGHYFGLYSGSGSTRPTKVSASPVPS